MFKRVLSLTLLFCFFLATLGPLPDAHADLLNLPAPGTMVSVSPAFQPALIKGLTVHKDNPFLFDFIVDPGQSQVSQQDLKEESDRMIKYFFASLTLPDKDVWVNLSPYEKDRMIPESLGVTAMGRDLLAQDYMLKQLTASLIYPQQALGKEFWAKVYRKAKQMYGTTEVSVNTFNKVWIVPQSVGIYEQGQTAYIVNGHLKVMLEEDYLSLQKHASLRGAEGDEAISKGTTNSTHAISSQIIRQIVLPEIEKEVNEDKNFATLRQIFYAQALAVWFKRNLKQALLNRVYANKGTVKGIDQNNPSTNEAIYQQYLRAYKKGVFNYIKEDVDPVTQESMPRKYFSGGYLEGRMPEVSAPLTQAARASISRAMIISVVAARPQDAAALANASNAMSTIPVEISLFIAQAIGWKVLAQAIKNGEEYFEKGKAAKTKAEKVYWYRKLNSNNLFKIGPPIMAVTGLSLTVLMGGSSNPLDYLNLVLLGMKIGGGFAGHAEWTADLLRTAEVSAINDPKLLDLENFRGSFWNEWRKKFLSTDWPILRFMLVLGFARLAPWHPEAIHHFLQQHLALAIAAPITTLVLSVGVGALLSLKSRSPLPKENLTLSPADKDELEKGIIEFTTREAVKAFFLKISGPDVFDPTVKIAAADSLHPNPKVIVEEIKKRYPHVLIHITDLQLNGYLRKVYNKDDIRISDDRMFSDVKLWQQKSDADIVAEGKNLLNDVVQKIPYNDVYGTLKKTPEIRTLIDNARTPRDIGDIVNGIKTSLEARIQLSTQNRGSNLLRSADLKVTVAHSIVKRLQNFLDSDAAMLDSYSIREKAKMLRDIISLRTSSSVGFRLPQGRHEFETTWWWKVPEELSDSEVVRTVGGELGFRHSQGGRWFINNTFHGASESETKVMLEKRISLRLDILTRVLNNPAMAAKVATAESDLKAAVAALIDAMHSGENDRGAKSQRANLVTSRDGVRSAGARLDQALLDELKIIDPAERRSLVEDVSEKALGEEGLKYLHNVQSIIYPSQPSPAMTAHTERVILETVNSFFRNNNIPFRLASVRITGYLQDQVEYNNGKSVLEPGPQAHPKLITWIVSNSFKMPLQKRFELEKNLEKAFKRGGIPIPRLPGDLIVALANNNLDLGNPANNAMATGITRVPSKRVWREGGIDLSQANAAMHISQDANGGVVVNVDPALIARVEREGMPEIDPVIIGIRPADIKSLFGAAASI